jgi:hypothetical protein
MKPRSVLNSIRNFLIGLVIIIAAFVVLIVMLVYGMLSWTKTFMIMHFGSQPMRARRQTFIEARNYHSRARNNKPTSEYETYRSTDRYM